MDNIFQLVFGHELIHVIKKDNMKIRKRATYYGIIDMILFFFVAILAIRIPIEKISLLLIIILSSFSLGISPILRSDRFWGQMSELRADKLSSKITGVSPIFFKLYFDSQDKIEKERSLTKKIDNENIYYKYYKREVEIEYHPNTEKRLQVLFNKRPWGIIYYIEHVITIFKWRIKRRGWNGR